MIFVIPLEHNVTFILSLEPFGDNTSDDDSKEKTMTVNTYNSTNIWYASVSDLELVQSPRIGIREVKRRVSLS